MMKATKGNGRRHLGVLVAAGLLALSGTAQARDTGDLREVEVPLPGNLSEVVKDRDAAVALGKALFWDMQVGVDEQYACATCHHKAGVDSRVNFRSLHPGANGQIDTQGPELTGHDFPFNRRNDDIVGSIGVPPTVFVDVDPVTGHETCDPVDDEMGHSVTGMASPSSVNAVFSERQFWDGRARSIFNGVNIHGDDLDRDEYPEIYVTDASGNIVPSKFAIEPASLASQAVGPVMSAVEMNCTGRGWPEVAMKMLPRKPLAFQETSPTDSVLGPYVGADGKFDDSVTYRDMVKAAFQDKYVSDQLAGDTGLTVEQVNFSMYWGVAVMLYEATLVSDDTPWDRYMRGDRRAVSASAKRGHEVFNGKGACYHCHRDAETSNAAITNGGNSKAFANIGVRPISENRGLRRGEHKSVTVRNAELTNPYLWNGSELTLRQLVRFYNKGGQFRGRHNELDPLGLTNREERDLVSFMLALTDDRVRCDAEQFDHPSLKLWFGEDLPAVGAEGLDQCWKPALDDGSKNFHYKLRIR
jgi:cytochrome c peroxidase